MGETKPLENQEGSMSSSAEATYQGTVADVLKVSVLGFALMAFELWLQGDILINLADEGYLWYGTWRTASGDVPVRDFQSYYPGRYYWGAAWFMALGNGIMALRISTGLFGAVGLIFGLLVLRRVIRSWWILAGSGVLLLLWMYPRYKIFEQSIAMAAVYFALVLVEKPSIGRHFAAGVFVGMAAFFGRNHGAYGFVSFLSLILFIGLKMDRTGLLRRIGAWGAGIFVGFSPMLLMVMLVPGFFGSVVDSIILIFRIEGTNLYLPVPWPWKFSLLGADIMGSLHAVSTGILFLMLPLFYLGTGAYMVWSDGHDLKQKAPLAACVFVGAAYMHYVFSRADLDHLALGIHPLLIALLFFPFAVKSGFRRKGAVAALAFVVVASCFSVGMATPCYIKAAGLRGPLQKVDIRGDSIWVSKYTAGILRSVVKIHREKIGPGEGLLIAPHWTTFYPILERKAPLWDIYFLFKETEERQMEMIAELKEKGVDWVILGDVALDGREDLRFRNTHHLLWKHIVDAFEPVQVEGLPGNYQLLKRK
jgi:hypothetical protein